MRVLTMALPLAAVAWPLMAAAEEVAVPHAGTGGVGAASPAEGTPAAPAVAMVVPPGPATGPTVVTPPVETSASWYGLSEGKHLGLQLDAGAPDGAGLSLLFRPWWWVRLNGGVAYNYLGVGVRGGVTMVPFHWGVTPSLSLDYGHYFSGDATMFASNPTQAQRALLQQVGYDFASVQVGLEFGSQRSFAFYLRGGFAYVTSSASGAAVTAYANERFNDPSIQATFGDAKLTSVLPCASLGMIFYVY